MRIKNKLIFAILLIISSINVFATLTTSNIEAFYPLDDTYTITDYYGVYDCTNHGATFGVDGADFETTESDYIDCSANVLADAVDKTFSISAMVNVEADGGPYGIVTKDDRAAPNNQMFNLETHQDAQNRVYSYTWQNSNGAYVGKQSIPDLPTGNWYHLAMTYNDTDQSNTLYVDGALKSTVFAGGTMTGIDSQAAPLLIGAAFLATLDRFMDGKIANVSIITSYILNQTEITNLKSYNGWVIDLLPVVITNVTDPEIDFTATDFYDGSNFNNFSINISNSTDSFYNFTTSGRVTFPNLSLSGNYSVNFSDNNFFYFNESKIIQFNGSSQANASNITLIDIDVYRLQDIYSVSFSQNISNWVRSLNFSISYSCISGTAANIIRISNYSESPTSVSCTNRTINTYDGQYTAPSEGNYSIRFKINSNFGDYLNKTTGWTNFTADLNDPVITSLNITTPGVFGNTTIISLMQCTDSIYPTLEYDMEFNSNNIFLGNLSNNSIQNSTGTILQGSNSLVGVCSDLFSSTTNTTTRTIYFRAIALIDEKNNIPFDISNVSIARVYYDDNSSFFDFKTANSSTTNLTVLDTPNLRFEIGYADGTIISRYVNIGLDTDELRICANPSDVTHYEQLIVSSSNQPVTVKNIFSRCVVVEDYTRFAFQDALSLRFFSIAMPYYMYFYPDNTQTFLASIDGGLQQSYINLDTLEFAQNEYNLNILGSALTFDKYENDTILIYYDNLGVSISSLTVKITRMDNNSLVFTTNSFTNPNRWNIAFNYSHIGNITDTLIFKLEMDGEKSNGVVLDTTNYFNIFSSSGTMPAPICFVIGFLIMLFGLSFAASNLTFSWFGIIVLLIAQTIFSLGVRTWYITFAQGICAILMVYITICLLQKNTGEIS